MKNVCIAIDAMGGDFGPSEVIPALDIVLRGRPDVSFLIYGDEKKVGPFLSKYPSVERCTTLHHTDLQINNEDKPSIALRASKGTSMRMAIEAVKSGEAQAIVSAGNTGALMALAKIVLKPLEGIHRPALASLLPGIKQNTIMLDLGANVLVDSDNLVQFSILGAIFAKAYKKIESPTVGLLNVGSEDEKGPDHVRQAARFLQENKGRLPGDYVGFVEGDDITKGVVDVIVCDGYAGNVALKTVEGTGKLFKHYFSHSFSSSVFGIIGGVFAYLPLRALKKQIDPRRYNGGVFLGLNGICVKSHGGADALSFSSAVVMAVRLARQGYIDEVIEDIAKISADNEIEGA